jgi:hypothetical protein
MFISSESQKIEKSNFDDVFTGFLSKLAHKKVVSICIIVNYVAGYTIFDEKEKMREMYSRIKAKHTQNTVQ